MTIEQEQFNIKVSRSRVVVERAFGILKGRFRQLQKLPLRNINFMIEIIVACCVLHNLCVDNQDNGEDFYVGNTDVEENVKNDNEGDGVANENFEDRRALLFREMYPA